MLAPFDAGGYPFAFGLCEGAVDGDEEFARQKAMELAVLTLVSVEMEEYEARRLRSIFGKQAKMRELDANLLRQNVRKITYGSKTVKVLLKNNQVLEECDDA